MSAPSGSDRAPYWDQEAPWDETDGLEWDWGDLADDYLEPPKLRRPHPTKEEAEVLLADYLIDRVTAKLMYARECCTIAY